MVAVALVFSATLLKPVSGNSEQTLVPLTLLESVTAMADAMESTSQNAVAKTAAEEPAYMLESASNQNIANPCFESMMAIGCRIQSQIPIWNQFAAMFATTFGISCPAVGPSFTN